MRQNRRWTQAELAEQLQLSQNRLSELERGQGSFSAEQMLLLMQLFNTHISYFYEKPPIQEDTESLAIQNFLIPKGAFHLREHTGVPPIEDLQDVEDGLFRVLGNPKDPRLVTALCPVWIWSIDALNLIRVVNTCQDKNLVQRVLWLLDNIEVALHETKLSGRWKKAASRAQIAIHLLEDHLGNPPQQPDLFDSHIRTQKSIDLLLQTRHKSAEKYNILTSLRPEDFTTALREAYESHRSLFPGS